MKKPELIFEPDEMLRTVPKSWSQEVLLSQQSMFFLKDVCPKLNLDTTSVVAHARALQADGRDPYEVMGLRKIWCHWYVRMRRFAPYFRQHLQSHIKQVASEWNANALLSQDGVFLLSQVCRLIPFTSGQLRHQARKTPRAVCGIFLDEVHGYLVEMEVFRVWIGRLWQDGFSERPPKPERSEKPPKTKSQQSRKSTESAR